MNCFVLKKMFKVYFKTYIRIVQGVYLSVGSFFFCIYFIQSIKELCCKGFTKIPTFLKWLRRRVISGCFTVQNTTVREVKRCLLVPEHIMVNIILNSNIMATMALNIHWIEIMQCFIQLESSTASEH